MKKLARTVQLGIVIPALVVAIWVEFWMTERERRRAE